MEKEDAEKAITELDDSVTSKEDDSLAEKNENTNGVEAETPVSPLDTGEPSEAIENKAEELPEKVESEEENKISPDESDETKSSSETTGGKKDKPVEALTEEKTPATKETPKTEEVPVPDDEPAVISTADTTDGKEDKPVEALTEEKTPATKGTSKTEEVPVPDEEPAVISTADTTDGKEDKPVEALAEEKTPESKETPKTEEVSVPDEEPAIISATDGKEDKPIEALAEEKTPESKETPKTEEVSVPDEEPTVISAAEGTEKSQEIIADGETSKSGEESKPDEAQVKGDVVVEEIDAKDTEQVEKPEAKATSKEKEKKSAKKKETAKDDKVIEEHPAAEEHHDEYQNADFATYSKEELVEVIKNLGKDENPFLADRILKNIAPLFNKIRSQEREVALKNFIKEGGVEDDFQYKPDELSLRFDANYKLIKDKKTKKFKEQDIQRGKNLILAEEALNELRDFVDSEESSGSFNSFKVLQQKWKDIGDVPSQNSRTLWANYNALVHRFYDQRSIYFELKELDRKKNYESKLILCDKAEALVKVENLREAIKVLNDLHHEFKHLGPVPLNVQEELWQRFKAASDKVYERRKAFVHELKAELHENLVKKQELIEKIKLFIEFQSDRIKEWNEKTKELIALQNTWEKIGGMPKDKAKQINKEFWSSFKKFFSNKHLFFKKLDADRDEHLVKKQELLAQANALKDSEEWDKTANELKKLQSQWREIGPVPEKMRKKLYDEFKACCDHFFENRRVGVKNSHEDYKVNLKKKKKVIEDIIKLKKDADKNLDKFNELRKEFLEMGYVPKKNITSIKEEYQNAVESYLNDLTILNVKQKTEISLEAEFASLAGAEHSETELYHKEQSVRRQINKLEDDIALWQNNLEFFAHSKSTDKLREEVNKKIDDASVHVESLKRQLKMLRKL